MPCFVGTFNSLFYFTSFYLNCIVSWIIFYTSIYYTTWLYTKCENVRFISDDSSYVFYDSCMLLIENSTFIVYLCDCSLGKLSQLTESQMKWESKCHPSLTDYCDFFSPIEAKACMFAGCINISLMVSVKAANGSLIFHKLLLKLWCMKMFHFVWNFKIYASC